MSPFLRMNRRALRTILTLALIAPMLLPAGCERVMPAPAETLQPRSYTDLQGYFEQLEYDLAALDQGVPRLQVTRLPHDFTLIPNQRERKRLFVLTLLPMVLMTNEEIRADRTRVEQLFAAYDRREDLSPYDRQWLDTLSERYRLGPAAPDDPGYRRRLLRRVDTLPVSLALAQAANESGWGTSRFALEGNNLFGEWTFIEGAGLVPRERKPGATHEVRLFPDLAGSLRSYMHNLNTHRAYGEMRRLREQLRSAGEEPSGPALVGGIRAYSERGSDYVRDIERMIRENRFTLLADSQLR